MTAAGRAFHKMCGSGNDFVFFDARTEPAGALAEHHGLIRGPPWRSICLD